MEAEMKIDLHTKIVLTVIAASMIVLLGQNAMRPANAYSNMTFSCSLDNTSVSVDGDDFSSLSGTVDDDSVTCTAD
jgi:hypothetical protein